MGIVLSYEWSALCDMRQTQNVKKDILKNVCLVDLNVLVEFQD